MRTEEVNNTRYLPGMSGGHYESFFLRANHPSRPLAFWFRYTIFSPKGRPNDALAELWAVWSDGEQQQCTAAKLEMPLRDADFAHDRFRVSMGDSRLDGQALNGRVKNRHAEIEWHLNYSDGQAPLLVLDRNLYEASIPKAKLLVGSPLARFNGTVTVNGDSFEIRDWVGSQNHNWGPKHTDRYAWGQVAGFDEAPNTFFEVATAKLKFGPVWTPFMTVMVLRHHAKEYRLNTIMHALKAKASFQYFEWHFDSAADGVRIKGSIRADRWKFVGLPYYNPPGGTKYCLNSKIASCRIALTDGGITTVMNTASRAAFEILTDDATGHGIRIEEF